MKTLNYYDLLDAFKLSGCPICRLLKSDAHRFLDTLLYEFVVDRTIQAEFRKSRGLCNVHAWHLTEMRGGNVGTAILCQVVLDEVSTLLSSASKKTASPLNRLFGQQTEGALLAERLEPAEHCMCCVAVNASEKRYLETLSESLDEPNVRTAFTASAGFCLPHFRMLLKESQRDEVRAVLIEGQAAIWKALIAELELFRYKVDPRWDGDPMGPEGNSWVRATEMIAGGERVFPSQRE
ncbi:MAG: hypothetical protein IPK17_07875 [Chloroflexi bacterium]|uniref:DUF6062 family protein n=1 Tax=Candidatus Flexifilum breve TaxID=3140694 RepID=UPI003134ECA4|nr:hypothetical protein [Chloroflexota bacterium]